jgi:curved DNA-binding protein CbpA
MICLTIYLILSIIMSSYNFDDYKYNLYDIMGLTPDATDVKIKKSFKKLVFLYHPDINKESSDEFLNQLIEANKILSHPNTRKEYDNYLKNKNESMNFSGLKSSFDSQIKDIEKFFPSKDLAKNIFTTEIEKLNKKHGATDNLNGGNVLNSYENIKNSRNSQNSQITIPQEKISNIKEFNQKFETKKDTGLFDDQIQINTNTNLTSYQPNDMLVSINDYSKLYSEDSVCTGNYTSLDMAFKIQKVDSNFQNISLEDRMKNYKNQTTNYNNRKPNDFSTKQFSDW